MMMNRLVPEQLWRSPGFVWTHLAVVIGFNSLYYASLRTWGFSEDAGWSIAVGLVIAGVLVPNLCLALFRSIGVRPVTVVALALLPSAAAGLIILVAGPSAHDEVVRVLRQLNLQEEWIFLVTILFTGVILGLSTLPVIGAWRVISATRHWFESWYSTRPPRDGTLRTGRFSSQLTPTARHVAVACALVAVVVVVGAGLSSLPQQLRGIAVVAFATHTPEPQTRTPEPPTDTPEPAAPTPTTEPAASETPMPTPTIKLVEPGGTLIALSLTATVQVDTPEPAAPTPTTEPAAPETSTPTPTRNLIEPSSTLIAVSPRASVLADTPPEVPADERIDELLREKELLIAQLHNIEEVVEENREAMQQVVAEVHDLEMRLEDEASDDKALQDEIARKQGVADDLKSEVARLETQRDSLIRNLSALNENFNTASLKALTVLEAALRDEITEKGEILRWQVILGFLTLGVLILAIVTYVFDTEILMLLKRVFRKKSGITLVSLTSPASAGSSARLVIEVAAGTSCTPCVIYRSGKASPRGLESKTADSSGQVSWTWQVHPNTTPGRWTVGVDCDPGDSMRWLFVVKD